MSWWGLLAVLAFATCLYGVLLAFMRRAVLRRVERDGPPTSPPTWVAGVICAMLAVYIAFAAGLLERLSPLRVGLFLALTAAALVGFRRGAREFFE